MSSYDPLRFCRSPSVHVMGKLPMHISIPFSNNAIIIIRTHFQPIAVLMFSKRKTLNISNRLIFQWRFPNGVFILNYKVGWNKTIYGSEMKII